MEYSVRKSDYGNFILAVGDLPNFKYQVKRLYTDADYRADLYWASDEETGLVSFFYHNPSNESGFSGRVFHLPMEDGTIKSIKGPWCSSASLMNEYFPHSIEILVFNDCTLIPSANKSLGYALLVDKAEEVLYHLGCDLIYPFLKDQARYEIA